MTQKAENHKNKKNWLDSGWIRLRKREPPDELQGTPEFEAFFSGLDKKCDLYKRVKAALEALKENMLAGDKIEKKKWTKMYVKKYGVYNLFRIEAGKESRLIYTIIAEDDEKIVCVLDFFSDHKEYERRFGYSWTRFWVLRLSLGASLVWGCQEKSR